MEVKTVGLASDHAGFALKQFVKQYLDERGIAYKDYGTLSEESCDYPDFGHALAKGVSKAIGEKGWLGVLTGGLTATAGGITAAVVFGVLMALIFKPGDKR